MAVSKSAQYLISQSAAALGGFRGCSNPYSSPETGDVQRPARACCRVLSLSYFQIQPPERSFVTAVGDQFERCISKEGRVWESGHTLGGKDSLGSGQALLHQIA